MMAVDGKRLSEVRRVMIDRDGAPHDVERALRAERESAARQANLERVAGAEGILRQWFVIRTANRSEKAVDDRLRLAGIETWMATKTVALEVKHTRRRRNVERPVWLGYLFVRVVPSAAAWVGLRGVDGVVSVLGTERGPLPVKDEIINDLRGLVAEGAFNLKRDGDIAIGTKVMIERGPMKWCQGVLDGYVGTRAARVMVPVFGGIVPVEIGLEYLGRVE